MYHQSIREHFFKGVENVEYVGMFLRLVPNPTGDLLLLLQKPGKALLGYPPRDVLTESELEKVYNLDTSSSHLRFRGTTIKGLVNLTKILKKPVQILEDQIGSKTSFCLLDVEIPCKKKFSKNELEEISIDLYGKNPKLGLLPIK